MTERRASWESSPNSLEYWDYTIELECLRGPEDLQLAAELGKTLLERNKELEISLKQHQGVIDDQTQEIEYLTKQTAALREVNDSRLRIYEQLEVSIQDLERTNQRLALENSGDKKRIKSLCHSIDALEGKCEELQRSLEEVQVAERQRRRRERRRLAAKEESTLRRVISMENGLYQNADCRSGESTAEEEVTNLLAQIQELRSQRAREHQRVEELEEQLAGAVQDNVAMQEKLTILRHKEDQVKSLEEEIMALEEVRQGHLCGRCLRSLDLTGEVSSLLDSPDEEEGIKEEEIQSADSGQEEAHTDIILSSQESLKSPASASTQGRKPDSCIRKETDNPYRVLIEKYEALLSMQRKSGQPRRHRRHVAKLEHKTDILKEEDEESNSLSLQEELQLSGNFMSHNENTGSISLLLTENNFHSDDKKEQEAKENEQQNVDANNARNTSVTPTTDGGHDFSETETLSSGFSEDIRYTNKGTQTDGSMPANVSSPASGGTEGFSTDSNPVDKHFKKAPEYKELFQEIFSVLKRSLSNENLLKDNYSQEMGFCVDEKQVPVLPYTDNEDELPLQRQKNLCSDKAANCDADISTKSIVMIKDTYKPEKTRAETTVNVKSNQKVKKQRKSNLLNLRRYTKEMGKSEDKYQISERVQKVQEWEFTPFKSSASVEVAKLRRLEKSYADVLRYGTEKSGQSLSQRK